ncbi:MAG TPA: GNAT family N-acetyltransferase [Methylovirgula sp.]|nr:GNAT family N-acetyltransferase [Methylovirgula sp.]
MNGASLEAALRPFLPADTPVLAQIFRDSVEELTSEDYDEAQRTAWIASVDDEARFGRRLAEQLTIVATRGGAPVGFASLKGADHIDMLYVSPEAAHEGIGTLLYAALEKLARNRGATKLTADVSDTALPFLERHGFRPRERQSIAVNGEWLANTRMEKKLGSPPQ